MILCHPRVPVRLYEWHRSTGNKNPEMFSWGFDFVEKISNTHRSVSHWSMLVDELCCSLNEHFVM
jgi:hypothetical protein